MHNGQDFIPVNDFISQEQSSINNILLSYLKELIFLILRYFSLNIFVRHVQYFFIRVCSVILGNASIISNT